MDGDGGPAELIGREVLFQGGLPASDQCRRQGGGKGCQQFAGQGGMLLAEGGHGGKGLVPGQSRRCRQRQGAGR